MYLILLNRVDLTEVEVLVSTVSPSGELGARKKHKAREKNYCYHFRILLYYKVRQG